MNLVILMGYLGNDPELTWNANGTAKLALRLATKKPRLKKGTTDQWEEVTEWHDVTIFGKRAEGLAKSLVKRRFVGLCGESITNKWDDKASGQPRRRTEVVVGPHHGVALGPMPPREDDGGAVPPPQGTQQRNGAGRGGGRS